MAFKLIEAAQDRWRAVNGPRLVALVRAGASFESGKLVERPDGEHLNPKPPKDLHPQVLTIALDVIDLALLAAGGQRCHQRVVV